MGGGLMQLVAYGAQDVYLTGNPRSLSGRLHTEDTLTLLWNLLNKHLTDRLISVAVSSALSPEMVILHTAHTFRLHFQKSTRTTAELTQQIPVFTLVG